jgi:hypothetical protein
MDVVTGTSGTVTTINETNNNIMSTTLNSKTYNSTINNNENDENTRDLMPYKTCKET